MITKKRITLIIGGSIAAYKAAELVRLLVKAEASVHVVMTSAASQFITPLTMQTLSGNPVATELFDLGQESQIGHIRLASEADLIVVAPATADLMAKAAQGLADNIATSILLAADCPVLFAPAMNCNMWTHPATQRNLEILRERGASVIEPESGELACGSQGQGRLAENCQIIEQLNFILTEKDLTGSRVIVTAGPTREALDPIRFISNRSSGKMGYAIAADARNRGAEVVLISGPTHLSPPAGVEFHRVSTAVQMHDLVFDLVMRPAAEPDPASEFVFMVSAVSDHRPELFSSTKLKNDKEKPVELKMVPNPDILSELGKRRAEIEKKSGRHLTIVGFAAETTDPEALLVSAREKLARKKSDLIVGNLASDAFEHDTSRVWLVDRNGREEEVALADKTVIARRIISAALAVGG